LAEAPWRLVNTAPGTLDGLARQPLARRAPGPGEIEIAVEATGLNFRDVLNALGLYPGEPPLGGECAGRVVAVGPGAEGFAPGDAAVAVVAGAFASHVTVAAALAAPLPQTLSMADGAGFAIPFITAEYCLRDLGTVVGGERVLIHAATGGVGMAALQLARRIGARIFATAGTQEKRALLLRLGAAHVMDSRSTDFAEEVLAVTGGQGVDLVLNALTGEFVDASLRALAPGGRFIELGLRDVRDQGDVEALGKGIRYLPVNWGEVAKAEPERIGRLLRRITDAIATGEIVPLPSHVFGPERVNDAFRLMAQAQHVGKVVVSWTGRPSPGTRRAGSYLITGGLSGLGLDTARRLAAEGAGRLVLTGRRGAGPEAESAMTEIRASGTRVEAHAVDAADEAGMARLLDWVRDEGPPLRGVVHAAGVLADAGLMQQGPKTLRPVIATKLGGAEILDRLTRGDPLDVFCVFSSIAGVLGSPGQLNHAAANSALSALVRDRVRRGLPGLAIDWGAWAGIGAAAADDTVARLAAQGIAALSPSEGRAACANLAAETDGQIAVAPIDWTRLAERRSGALGPFFARMTDAGAPKRIETSPRDSTAPILTDLPQRLAEAPPARRRATLDAFLEDTLRTAFALPPGRRIDPETPFGEMGLDSLLAVEVRNRLGRGLNMRLPTTLLFEQPTLAVLGAALLRDLFPEQTAPSPASGDSFTNIEEMTDEELDRMLGLGDSQEIRT
jgi:NADPH:quinone reductase-like Zn-dependent oxidoreductase/NADP-dependent 3-hydroxy acid dehydrogenase YdfG